MRLRRAGFPWRLLVHRYVGKGKGPLGCDTDLSVNVYGESPSRPSGEYEKHEAHPGTEFDELVVGKWLHVEQMDTGIWWMNIGGVTLLVSADRDGRPTKVQVFGPNDYDTPVEGCGYSLHWDGR